MTITPLSIEPRLAVSDVKASVDFYRELLGVGEEDTVFEVDGFAILRKGKIGIQLVTFSGDHPLSPNTVWIDVLGLEAFHEQIKGRYTVEWGPGVYAYGRRELAILDLDGHRIIFSEPSTDATTCAG